MEQMYLIETFIDKVAVFVSDDEPGSGATKNLIVKIKFGPKVQFIVKEGQLAPKKDRKDDIVECDEHGRRKWTRTIRVGKSYLFPSYPDTVLMILSKFPLEIEVWNDDENEIEIFVGVGTMHWDTEFFFMLKETAHASILHTPLTIKTVANLMSESCGKQVGEVSFILRLSALGDSIITEFQQLMSDPDVFAFRTDKAPSMFQCKRIEGNDPNFCMVGSLYESTTLEEPGIVSGAKERIEICTQLESCATTGHGNDPTCQPSDQIEEPAVDKKKYPIDKIRMGDITGPCGNSNCPLAHKVKNYIRALDSYKKQAGSISKTSANTTKKICGGCLCKDDRYHKEDCPDKQNRGDKTVCSGCGGSAHPGQTCVEQKTQVTYVFGVHHVPDFKESIFGRNFIDENLAENYATNSLQFPVTRTSKSVASGCHKSRLASEPNSCSCDKSRLASEPNSCGCNKSQLVQSNLSEASCGPNVTSSMIQPVRSIAAVKSAVYNVDVSYAKANQSSNCTSVIEDKDCKCDTPKPAPACRTFDCDCITEIRNIAARKAHKPYCPSYKHKNECPVTRMNKDIESKKKEDEDEEDEVLPYGLPPIQLGPCPIMGRPCSVPDGFARMYKNAVAPSLPPSFSEGGKISCSKEFVRIKRAINEYMKHEKEDDYRCINKFNVDTERRCCDKENRELALTGKACCGSHKIAIQEKFKDQKK